MFDGLRHRRSMFITSNSCSSCPTISSATNYRWRIEVDICTAGQSVCMVFVQVGIRISGARASSIRTFRERSSRWKSSRLQMVTLRQPATTPSLLGHSFDLPIANVLQYEVMWLTIHQSYRSSGRDTQLLALASTWPTLASTEALLTVELPQAVRPDRSTHRFTIQANAEVVAPESRGQR